MSTVIKTRLVKIGNSQGVRIPKVVRDQLGLTDTIELEVYGDHIILRASSAPRTGWAEEFRCMAEQRDDTLVDGEGVGSDWEANEWRWE
jgi:antitoxin MazE